jgi:hypothetical protein
MCGIRLRAANQSLLSLALALVLVFLVAVWAVGMAKYLSANMPSDPPTKTQSLGR